MTSNISTNSAQITTTRLMTVVMLLGGVAAGASAVVIGQREGFTMMVAIWTIASVGQLAGAMGHWQKLRKLLGRD